MVKYTLLHKEESTQVSYFFNLEDGFIYSEHKQMDNAVVQKVASIGGVCGAFFALIYQGEQWSPQNPGILFIVLMVLGILLGWSLVFWINNKTGNRVFVQNNRVIMTQAEMVEMYNNSKQERKKYWILFGGLLVFSIVCTFIFCYIVTNILLILCCVIMWFGLAVLLFAARPICRIRMGRYFTKVEKNLYE